MCRCIYAICQHPEVEARVAAELGAAGLLATLERPQPRCMEHADLAQLTYLQCVIKVGSHTATSLLACLRIIHAVVFTWRLPMCTTVLWFELRVSPSVASVACEGMLTRACAANQESIRLRPVLPILFRRAMKDVQIGPYLFPEGTILELHTLAMNTHPKYWECPDDFVPVRYINALSWPL